jgi:hypothetical protein
MVVVSGLAMVLVCAACTGGGSSYAVSSGPSPTLVAPPTSGTIPQPPLDRLNERTRRRLAPANRRIDLIEPSFSHPTEITNPLFPISELRSAVLVGKLDGHPWRAETTLLPDTKTIDWQGRQVETRQSQFVAYLDGRIFEVAVDLYAQADDGSVWYFGEDAFTYEHGRPVDIEGTWRAGVNGPPAMIMPGRPEVGDVYRTENIPGLVFEEVTVTRVGVTMNGPSGPVDGAIVGRELHMDEARLEEKRFAPGYGEFFSGGGRTFEANALAVPTDALAVPMPPELDALSAEAIDASDAARTGGWGAASAALDAMKTAWRTDPIGEAATRLRAQMTNALHVLARAIHARNGRAASQAALDVARADLDLQLLYRPQPDVDRARFDLWTRELQMDATAGDRAAVVGDVTTLEWVRDRIRLDSAGAGLVDDQLRSIEAAAEAGDVQAAAAASVRLRESLAGLRAAPSPDTVALRTKRRLDRCPTSRTGDAGSGRSGIRTHERVAPLTVFKTVAFVRSAILPAGAYRLSLRSHAVAPRATLHP